jgi:hypothetical protein
MPAYIKNSSTWGSVSQIWVKVSSTWRSVSQGWINVSGTWRQFFATTRTYTFYLGNTVHIGTNGYISLDSGQSTYLISSTVDRVLGILPADLQLNSIRYAADSSKFYVFYRGKRLSGGTDFEIEYEVHFTNGQDYALVKLVAFPTSTYSLTGYYVDGSSTGYSRITATRTVGAEYRVYFGTTSAFATTFTEYGVSTHPVWLAQSTLTSGSADDGYITVVANQGASAQAPTSVAASSITGTTATISWDAITNANAGMSAIQSYNYSINSGGSWSSTGSGTSVNLTGLTGNTSYTVLVRANNYFFTGTNYGSVTFTTASVPGTPTITFSSVTATAFTATWSATGATTYNVDAFRSVSGAALTDSGGFTYPRSGTSATTATFTGLNGTLSHSVSVAGVNSGGTGPTFSASLIGTPAVTFGSNTSVSGGFTGSVNNRDSAYTYSFAVSSGTVTPGSASGSSYPFTVSGLSAGASATVTVTATRAGYFNGTGSTTGSATSPTPNVSRIVMTNGGGSTASPNSPRMSITITSTSALSLTYAIYTSSTLPIGATSAGSGTISTSGTATITTNSGAFNNYYEIYVTPYAASGGGGASGTTKYGGPKRNTTTSTTTTFNV